MKILLDYNNDGIRLTEERLSHILEHPEMKGLEDKIKQTLLQPEWVIRSSNDPSVRLYYRKYYGILAGDKFLCIVVKKIQNDLFILTAFSQIKRKKENFCGTKKYKNLV